MQYRAWTGHNKADSSATSARCTVNVEGLTSLTTDHLKRLLKYLHGGSLTLPLDAHGIAAAGFQFRHQELMSALRGLDEPAVRAVLVCVLAKRIAAENT